MSAPETRPHARGQVRQLSAAVRARTILASCDRVVVRFPDDTAPEDGRPAGNLVGWDGVPYLLPEPGRRPPTGRIHLTCDGDPRELGTLTLRGQCGAPRQATAVPGLSEHLLAHSAAPAGDAADVLDIARAAVVPVIVEQVRVLTEGARQVRRVLPVPIELFQRARPDLWAVHGADIVRHLNQHHQEELRQLVQARARQAASAVVVRGLGPHGLSLACLTDSGVSDLGFPFNPPITHPHDLGRWFRHQIPASPRPPEEPRA